MRLASQLTTILLLAAAIGNLQSAEPESKEKAGYFGVIALPLKNDLFRQHMRIPTKTGLVVIFVNPKSPAEAVGMAKDDVLLSIDGKPLTSPEQFGKLVRSKQPGESVVLEVIASGTRKIVKATLEKRSVVRERIRAAAHQQPKAPTQMDLKAINDTFNDPKLSNDEKSKRINAISQKHFPNLDIVVTGRSIDVVPSNPSDKTREKASLETLQKSIKDLAEARDEADTSASGIKVQIIRSGKTLILLEESRQRKHKTSAPVEKE